MNGIESMGNKIQKDIASLANTFKQSSNTEIQSIANSLEDISEEIRLKVEQLGNLTSDLILYKKLDLDSNAETEIIVIQDVPHNIPSENLAEFYTVLKDVIMMTLTASYKNNKIPSVRFTNTKQLNELLFIMIRELEKEGFKSKLELYSNLTTITKCELGEVVNLNPTFTNMNTNLEKELLNNADCILAFNNPGEDFKGRIIRVDQIPMIVNLIK